MRAELGKRQAARAASEALQLAAAVTIQAYVRRRMAEKRVRAFFLRSSCFLLSSCFLVPAEFFIRGVESLPATPPPTHTCVLPPGAAGCCRRA